MTAADTIGSFNRSHTTSPPSTSNSPIVASPDVVVADKLTQKPVLLVTAGYDHTIRFWNILDGSCSATLQHNESQVNKLAISEDKRWLAVAGNPNIRIFDIDETFEVSQVDFSASTANLSPKHILQGHQGNVTSIGFSSSRAGESAAPWLFSSSTDGFLRLWTSSSSSSSSSWVCCRNFNNSASINDSALHPNQAEIVFIDVAGWVKIIDLSRIDLESTDSSTGLNANPNAITTNTGASVSPCNNKSFVKTEWFLGNERGFIPTSTTTISCAASSSLISLSISEDGKYLAVLNEVGTVFLWTHSPDPEATDNNALSSSFKPWIRVQVNDAFDSKRETASFATKCRFSPDSRWLATCGSSGQIKLWLMTELELNPKPAIQLLGHANWVWDLTFSADSAFLLSASSDGTARLWDLKAIEMKSTKGNRAESNTSLAIYSGHAKAVTAIALNDLVL